MVVKVLQRRCGSRRYACLGGSQEFISRLKMPDHREDDHDEQVDLDGENDIDEMIDDGDDPNEDDDYYRRDESADEGDGSEDEGHGTLKESDEDNNALKPKRDYGDDNGPTDEQENAKHAELLGLPPHGSEVFIGGLSRDSTEEDLKELCKSCGDIFEVRLVKDKETKESKGYAFITFTSRDSAEHAIEEIHDKEFKGRKLRCSLSQSKHRLFIGNIPKSLGDEEIKKILEMNGPGVEKIELLKDAQNPSRNRGFVFVEYYNHACADYSRQKMSNSNFKIDGTTPTVTWADPKNSDTSATSQVKAVYVKNLPESVTSERLKELFERHGEITKVVLPPPKAGSKRDFGFIHFADRSSALKAVKSSEKYEMDGNALEAVLAKPQSEKRTDHGPSYRPGLLPAQPSYNSGFVDPYGAYGGYGQPVIYGRGPMPSGMRMVPMVLPDGRLGYVLQQPGAPPPGAPPPPPPYRRRGKNSDADDGGRGSEGGRGRRYRPY